MRILLSTFLAAVAFAVFACGGVDAGSMPLPFKTALSQGSRGDDVVIAQNLLVRSSVVTPIVFDGDFGPATAAAVSAFQKSLSGGAGSDEPGVLGPDTAAALLEKHLHDGYKFDGRILPGYKYLVHVPVHADRTIETTATLYDANMTALHSFTIRAHGQDHPDQPGVALNQLTSSGNTPTGLGEFDLNSPEPDPVSYGPYPINRVTRGLAGNMHIFTNATSPERVFLSDFRDGILMHTGEWPNWDPSQPMPNSHGCMHGHPEDIKTVWKLLVSIGVQVRDNPGGQLPYPYQPQGLIAVEQID